MVPIIIPSLYSQSEEHWVQVAFASGQFWVLVVVDFVMLLMRDVRTCKQAPTSVHGFVGHHVYGLAAVRVRLVAVC